MTLSTVARDVLRSKLPILDPAPPMAPWVWAEKHRVFPKTNPEPGPFRARRAPWVKTITETVTHPAVRTAVLVQGAQTSKTDGVLLPCAFWAVDLKKKPVAYYGPTRELVHRIVERRIEPVIADTPHLAAAVASKHDDRNWTKLLSGVPFVFGWTGSSSSLRQESFFLVLVDDTDAMRVLRGEGHPWNLAKARIRAYPGGTAIAASTPTEGRVDVEVDEASGIERWKPAPPEAVSSFIWREWQTGTRREWTWPCPVCKTWFVPRSKHLVWDGRDDPEAALASARLKCPACGEKLHDHQKRAMNDKGLFTAPGEVPLPDGTVENPVPPHAAESFHVNGLCSNFAGSTWGVIAHDVAKARLEGEPGKEQAEVNVAFGECWGAAGEAPSVELVRSRMRDYVRGQVRPHCARLFGGVDIGKREIWWVVRGFGPGWTSDLVDYGRLDGWTGDPDGQPWVWAKLAEVMRAERGEDRVPVTRVMVDSRFLQDVVYRFCREQWPLFWPSAGGGTIRVSWKESYVDHDAKGRPLKNGLRLTSFDTVGTKRNMRAKVTTTPATGEYGGWYIPRDVDEEYLEHQVAEEEVEEGGIRRFDNFRRPNHLFDAEVLTFVACRSFYRGSPIVAREPGRQRP